MGAGAGIGGTAGKRFAQEGYHSVLCRRSDEDGLNNMVEQIRNDGGEASGFLMNATEDYVIEDRIAQIEADIGPIEVVIYNLGAQIGNRALGDTSYKAFELGWRMATFGLFRVASSVCPLMVERRRHDHCHSATAAVQGNAGSTHALLWPVAVCQSLNAEFSSQGIHIARFGRRHGRCPRYGR